MEKKKRVRVEWIADQDVYLVEVSEEIKFILHVGDLQALQAEIEREMKDLTA